MGATEATDGFPKSAYDSSPACQGLAQGNYPDGLLDMSLYAIRGWKLRESDGPSIYNWRSRRAWNNEVDEPNGPTLSDRHFWQDNHQPPNIIDHDAH